MRRLAPAAVILAALFHAPLPLVAETGGGTPALVPVQDMPPPAPAVNGAAEAPVAESAPVPAPAPAPAPTPVPADTPELVPAEEMGTAAAPVPETPPESVPQLQAMPAQEPVPDDPAVEEPATPPADEVPDKEETDPEEFEEEFDDEPQEDSEPEDAAPAPNDTPAAPAAQPRLPQTGTNLINLAGTGVALLVLGMWMRRVPPAPRRPRARPARKLPSAHAHARALRPPPGTNYGLPAHRWVLPPLR
jgi:LPXTG-motif cell wall-anchored protein